MDESTNRGILNTLLALLVKQDDFNARVTLAMENHAAYMARLDVLLDNHAAHLQRLDVAIEGIHTTLARVTDMLKLSATLETRSEVRQLQAPA